MERTLQSLAEYVRGRLIGDGTIRIRGINAVSVVQAGELTFADDRQRLEQALGSKASAILVASSVADLRGRSGIGVDNPKWAFARLLDLFHPEPAATGVVHPSAVVSASAVLAERVDVRAQAVIGERVRIGCGTIIDTGTVIGDDVTIGESCLIGPNVVVYRRTVIGSRVRVHGGSVIGGDGFGYVFHDGQYVKMPQVGNVIIEDDVELGCNVCVDRATIGSTMIQRGTKVDNLVQIAHNDRIGRHVIMSGQVGLSGSVTVGDYVRMGGKAGIVDHIEVGPQAEIGAASVVTKDVPAKTKVWGYPARPSRSTLQQMAALSRLPAIVKSMTQALQRLTRLERRLDRVDPSSKP